MVDLASRLVVAAAQALRDHRYVDASDHTMPRYYPDGDIEAVVPASDVARAAVAAALRELATDAYETGELLMSAGSIRALADAVENGAGS